MPRKRFLLLFLLAVIVLVMIGEHDDPNTLLPVENPFSNNYVLNEFRIKGYAANGQITQIITGKQLRQPVNSLEHSIDQPMVQLFSQGQPQWQLSSAHAWLDSTQENARLSGTLMLNELTPNGIRLRTDHLDLHLPSQKVSNDADVVIEQASNHIRGIGLQADLHASTLRLNAHVRGNYEP